MNNFPDTFENMIRQHFVTYSIIELIYKMGYKFRSSKNPLFRYARICVGTICIWSIVNWKLNVL